MGKGKDLSEEEKHEILQYLGKGLKTLDISRKMNRDHRTVKRFVCESEKRQARSDKGVLRKVSLCQINRIREEMKNPLMSSRQIFEAAGASGVPTTSRWRILHRLAGEQDPLSQPPLTSDPEEKALQWAQKYMKTESQTVLLIDECRATADGPEEDEVKT